MDFAEILEGKDSDITHYYVSETLMNSPIRHGMKYEQAINTVLSPSNTSCSLIQQCKALFLDKGAQDATDFLKDVIKDRQKQKSAREDFLVELFDNSFPGLAREDYQPSYEEFKEKYLVSSSLASQLAKETIAADRLDKIIKDKNYEEIEQIFQYYTLLREEHNLIAPDLMFSHCLDNPELLQKDVDPKVQP